MKIYYIMFFYVIAASLILRSYSLLDIDGSKRLNNIPFWAAWIIVMLPLIYIGFRSSVNDTEAYIKMFNDFSDTFHQILANTKSNKGVGWSLYEWFIKSFITEKADYFLLITAIIQMGAVVKIYRKYSSNYGLSIILYFLSMSFLYLMAGIRQMMAASIVFYCSDFLFDGKNIRFLLAIAFATTIHISALIWLPVMIAVKGKAFGINIIIFGIITVFIIIFINRFTDLLSVTLEDTLYEGYTEQFAHDDGSNIVHSLIAAVPVLIAFIGRQLIALRNDTRINILVNLSIMDLLLNIIAHYTSGILIGRLPAYLDVFTYALYPILLDVVFAEKSRRFVTIASIFGYWGYATYYIVSSGLGYTSTILKI